MSELEVEHSEVFHAALDSLIYENGDPKPFTLRSLALLERALSRGTPDALILKGIQYYDRDNKKALEYLTLAKDGGCHHHIMYYYLGLLCRGGLVSYEDAREYFTKALGGKLYYCILLYIILYYFIIYYIIVYIIPLYIIHYILYYCIYYMVLLYIRINSFICLFIYLSIYL